MRIKEKKYFETRIKCPSTHFFLNTGIIIKKNSKNKLKKQLLLQAFFDTTVKLLYFSRFSCEKLYPVFEQIQYILLQLIYL